MKPALNTAGGDGNLLMNVGPMPTGQIDPREEDRLKMVGEWLKINGESIYGTHGGPFLPDSNYASTYKDNQIYLHVFRRQNGAIVLPGIREKVMEVRILVGPKISFTQTDKNISFTLPEGYIKNIVTVVKLELDRPLNEEQIPIKFMRIN
jgi:alpha-L-fucosidase